MNLLHLQRSTSISNTPAASHGRPGASSATHADPDCDLAQRSHRPADQTVIASLRTMIPRSSRLMTAPTPAGRSTGMWSGAKPPAGRTVATAINDGKTNMAIAPVIARRVVTAPTGCYVDDMPHQATLPELWEIRVGLAHGDAEVTTMRVCLTPISITYR